MKDKLKRFGKWLLNKIIEDSDAISDEEEYKEFVSKIARRVKALPDNFGIIRADDPLQLALLIENAHIQKKITEANESLKIATWVLAFATIAFTIGTIYGVVELNKVFEVILQGIVGIIILVLGVKLVKGFLPMINFLIKWVKK